MKISKYMINNENDDNTYKNKNTRLKAKQAGHF